MQFVALGWIVLFAGPVVGMLVVAALSAFHAHVETRRHVPQPVTNRRAVPDTLDEFLGDRADQVDWARQSRFPGMTRRASSSILLEFLAARQPISGARGQRRVLHDSHVHRTPRPTRLVPLTA
jgi:hypothetical protein